MWLKKRIMITDRTAREYLEFAMSGYAKKYHESELEKLGLHNVIERIYYKGEFIGRILQSYGGMTKLIKYDGNTCTITDISTYTLENSDDYTRS